MKNRALAVALLGLFLAACKEDDGVPKLADPHNPVVDGKAMTKRAFLDKYCLGKSESETCRIVVQYQRIESFSGPKK
jgi:hypothetical protein